MNYKKLYIEIGKIAYAIAKADGHVQQDEIEKVFLFLNQQLPSVVTANENESFNHITLANHTFTRLLKQDPGVKQAYTSFCEFHSNNPALFTSELNHAIVLLVEKVALAHGGMEETEDALIDKLKKLLGQTMND